MSNEFLNTYCDQLSVILCYLKIQFFFFWPATSDKVYQLLAHGWWFSPGSLVSSITKTGRYDIAEILLRVAIVQSVLRFTDSD
jgi:hypothetical protein